MDISAMEKAADLRIQDFRRTLDELQGRASSVLLLTLQWREIEEQFDLTRNAIEARAKEVKAMEESVTAQILEVEKKEERLSKVEARLKELDSIEESINKKSKDLEKKEKEFGLKREEIERKEVDLELKIKQNQEKFELKEKKLEERATELGLKEKELEERSKKLISPIENSRPEVEPSAVSLLAKHLEYFNPFMDINCSLIHQNDDLMNSRAALALLVLSFDPAKLVLDVVQGFHQPYLKKSDGELDRSVAIKSCVLLLERLMKMNPKIEPEVKREATKLSIDWFDKVVVNPENEIEILECLLFLAVYGLASAFSPQLLFKLLERTILYDPSPKLFQLLGFKDKVSDVVEILIGKEEYFAAIKFLCEFRIFSKRASTILYKFLNSSRKAARRIAGTGNSPEVQRAFREKRKADAVVALDYIKETKSEGIFPIQILEDVINTLQNQLSQNTTTQGYKRNRHSLSDSKTLSAMEDSVSSEGLSRGKIQRRRAERRWGDEQSSAHESYEVASHACNFQNYFPVDDFT